MSIELLILSSVVGALALLAVLQPKFLFQYPVITSLVMWFFLMPQAWQIEAGGDLSDFEPTLTWLYILACVIMTFVGFRAGVTGQAVQDRSVMVSVHGKYDAAKLFGASCVLASIGMVSTSLLMRDLSAIPDDQPWTGQMSLYALLSSFTIYGGAIGWFLYLYTKSIRSLALSILCLCFNLPFIFFSARREVTFAVVTIVFLGLFFAKKKSLARIMLIPMLLVGSLLVGHAGSIRSYISAKDTNVVDALASEKIQADTLQASEMSGAVADIALAQWNGSYGIFKPYFNTFVRLYVPAFITTHEFKESLKFDEVEDDQQSGIDKYFQSGATRTGFSDSFRAFHFLGCFVFFIISFVMGKVWKLAMMGSMKAQMYYTLLLAAGLKAFTESTSIFFGTAPLVVIPVGLVFLYAKLPARVSDAGIPTPSAMAG